MRATQSTASTVVFLLVTSLASAQIDLGDIAVGGNGWGSAPAGLGLRTDNGQLIAPNVFGGAATGGPLFVRTDGSGGSANLPYVDGVYWIRGATQITSQPLTFPFPATGGRRWDALRNAAAYFERDLNPPLLVPIDLDDQPGVPRRGLGVHVNGGITFDLLKLRQAGYSFDAVRGVAGLNRSATAVGEGSVEIWVVLDGTPLFRHPFTANGDHYLPFNLPVGPQHRYLSIAATDLDLSPYADHAVVADLALVPEPSMVAGAVLVLLGRRR